MDAKPNFDLTPELPQEDAAASLMLPGDDEPSLKTFSLDSYAEDEAQHARCSMFGLNNPIAFLRSSVYRDGILRRTKLYAWHCWHVPTPCKACCRRLIADRLESDEQTAAVHGLLWRLLPPADAAKFLLRVDDGPGDSDVSSGDNAGGAEEQQPAACFEARSDGKRVHVRGTTGVEVAAGILHFLKYRQVNDLRKIDDLP